MATTMLRRTDVFFRNAKLALVAAGLLATVACSRGNVHAAAPAMPPPLVTAVQATTQDVPRYLDEIGRNAAFESVTVTPQVSGRIVERHFQDGENLRRGQLLFVIDPRPYKAQVDSAQAALAQAKAALDLAKIQFARDQEVIGDKAISQQDYDTKKNTVDVDQAQVEAAASRSRNCQAQPRVLLHSFSHRWPGRRASGRCGKRRAAERDVAAFDSAPRSHLREFHRHRGRSAGKFKSRCRAAR